MMAQLKAAAQQQTAGGGFDPETDIGHVSCSGRKAQSLLPWVTATEPCDAWPDEARQSLLTKRPQSKPQYRAAYAGLNNKPTVEFTGSTSPGIC